MTTRTLPTEKTMNVTDTKQNFSRVINEVARGESYIVVEKSGAPVAAIISRQELDEYRRLKERENEIRERLESSLEAFSAAFRDVPEEELQRVLADARREYREKTDREHGRQ
ncbi:MAG TPA: type II toxin-antitoxin system Phd/YefM family antitoxin [Thermomicrobiales bacterium]|nr:type II toxin-antitoxin system Phd/YefM family antitoxin [Thermomicrobiales bacterium]